MNYELYDSLLYNRFVWASIFSGLGILLSIWEFWNFKKSGHRTNSIVAIVLIILSAFMIYFATSYFHDMTNHSYIVYEGDFLVGNHAVNDSGSPLIYLPDKNGIKLKVSEGNYYKHVSKAGKFTGKLVYAEKSKYVVDILSAVKCEE